MQHTRIVPDAVSGETPPPADVLATATHRQFTIFTVDGETFGVSLDDVKEIIRMPAVVRVPLAPPSLEGLTNLRGTVLPVVNTRSLFGTEPAEPDDATRVVVLDRGQPIGIVVDRVVSVVSVDASRIEDAASVETSIRTDLLRGVIKDEGTLGLVMVLDAARLIEQEFDALAQTRLAGGGLLDQATEAAASTQPQDSAGDEDIQLVSFEIAGQEYALPIHSVREIVQLPDNVTRVPKAAPSVVGVISLRDRLLPVVSLRRMFGLAATDRSEHDRVAVVSLGDPAEGKAMLVGLLLDKVNEVLRVRESSVEPVPPMLAADSNLSDITAICRLAGGKRLVSILSAEKMFDQPAIAQVLEDALQGADAEETTMAGTDNRRASHSDDQEQFVVFRLLDEEFGVEIATVQEIVRVPDELAKVPRTEDFIRGVMSLRGAVIPLVDQRARFNLPPCEDHDRQRIVVFTKGGVQTGFIVDSVAEVMRVRRRDITPAPAMTERDGGMIRRVANLPDSGRMIMLLDTEKLLDIDPAQAAA
jgi:purine-binding chemotaxis protein CheW